MLERDSTRQSKVVYWICECECGNIKSIASNHLIEGSIVSCGCFNSENTTKRNKVDKVTHNLSKTREYKIWSAIKDRCYNKNIESYKDYGKRGIILQSEWVDAPELFINYIKSLKNYGTTGYSLDRINNDGNYEEGNLRWASYETQLRNTRGSKLNIEKVRKIRELKNKHSRKDLSEIFDISRSTINEIIWKKIWRDFMKYDTIYSKDSTGNTRIWWMEQEQDRYRTHSGLINGTITTSEWTTAKPKNVGRANATTAEEQALAEIQAKYLKQLKTGYHKDIGDIHTQKYIEPMLAQKYKDRIKDVEFESGLWAVQPKLNGQRCIATKNGLFTRKGETYVSVPHISESLKHFFEKYPDAFLDGELFNFELRQKLNELATLTRKTKNVSQEELERSRAIVQYHIYDGAGFGLDESDPYQDRILWLEENLSGSYIYLIDTYYPETQFDFEKLYNGFVEDGQEGAMLRHLGSAYEHKRSKWLLKVKPEEDDEGLLLEVHKGEGNWGNGAKTVTIQWKDKTFDVTLKCDIAESMEFWENKDYWIGKTVTFNYFGFTGLGCPQFCSISPNNCLKS